MNRPYIFLSHDDFHGRQDHGLLYGYAGRRKGRRGFTTLHSSKIHITAIRAVDRPVGFELKDAEVREGGSVWLGLLKR
ncbi:hypothetical protein [Lacrimispora brassicae]